MSSDQIYGQWKQWGISFREAFGRFTNRDIQELNGQREQLIGKLQEAYGTSNEEAERRYDEWSSSLSHATCPHWASAGVSIGGHE
jgi:uncharacterized protein YjbJ (UPF0337 family)